MWTTARRRVDRERPRVTEADPRRGRAPHARVPRDHAAVGRLVLEAVDAGALGQGILPQHTNESYQVGAREVLPYQADVAAQARTLVRRRAVVWVAVDHPLEVHVHAGEQDSAIIVRSSQLPTTSG